MSAFLSFQRRQYHAVLLVFLLVPMPCLLLASKARSGPPVKAADPLTVTVLISDGEKSVRRTRRELGFSLTKKTGPVTFTVDRAALKAALSRLAPAFHQDEQPARPMVVHGHIRFKPGAYARALNVPTTAETILQAATKSPGQRVFRVALDKHPPALTPARLKGITGVLATFSTQTSENAKRNHNIAVAAAAIDGVLLSPGEVFSLNETVGKRTHENGFLTAPVFVNAEKVPGVGGGVSQITGTLFNAAARAGLKIAEVHPHSRPVAYLPVGYDATVAYGEKDLKFQNNTAAPVFLDYRFDKKTHRLSATVWGAKAPGKLVRLKANVQRLGAGKVDAQLYRLIKNKGQVVAKERLFTHEYRWDPSKKE